MFLVLTNNLNKNEFIVLTKLLDSAAIISYGIYDVSKEDCVEKEILTKHKVILVYDQTKSKSTFEKNFEAKYGKETLDQLNWIRIDRPLTFQKSEEARNKVWTELKQLRNSISKKSVDIQWLPDRIPMELLKMLNGEGERKIYEFKDDLFTLSVYPDELKASSDNALSYQEFIILISAKIIFNMPKVNIYSNT